MSSDHGGQGEERGLYYRQWYRAEGEEAIVSGTWQRSRTAALLAPGTAFGIEFYATGAPISIGTQAYAQRVPIDATARTARMVSGQPDPAVGPTSPAAAARMREPLITFPDIPGGIFDPGIGDPTTPPPTPPPPTGGNTRHAPLAIDLYPPGASAPIAHWDLPEETTWLTRKTPYPGPGLPSPDAMRPRPGWWRCVIRPTGLDPVWVDLEVSASIGKRPLRERTLPKRLLENTMRMAFAALAPSVRVDGSTATISAAKDLGKLYGFDPFFKKVSISPISLSTKLRSVAIETVSGNELLAAAQKAGRRGDYTGADRVRPDDLCLRFRFAFQRSEIRAGPVKIADLGELGELYLSFMRLGESHVGRLTRALFIHPVRLTALARFLGFEDNVNDAIRGAVEGMLEARDYSRGGESIENLGAVIRSYLREALGRVAGRRGVAHDAWATPEGWRVRYFEDFTRPDESWRGQRPRPDRVPGVDPGTVVAGGSIDPSTGGGPPPPPPPPAEDTRGTWPDEFRVQGGAALSRLDRVQSFVFVMLENRSFDHLLGDLPRVRPRPGGQFYDGLPAGATNPPAGGHVDPIPATPAWKIGLDTAIWTSPHHHYDHVQFQIGGGTADTPSTGDMAGFTRDIADRTDTPQIAMSYYEEAQLPTYYKLVDQFMVADRWFCTHPGPTWPNRWATLLGSIPELDNLPMDDERFGFLDGKTIFEVLDEHGVDWRVFESDISLIRMFDRYRLDDQKVVPVDDPNDGLEATLRRSTLPRVMFIEPDFVDTPPLALASDDHPPANLERGQQLIARICNLLGGSRHWNDVLLVITYDEHGGFYDHVPPPGTAKGPPEWIGNVPRLHPDGADWMGPRVPTFIVSPYVSAGSVTHQVFDHLAVLKTILVHNRRALRREAFTSFGARVNQSPHLGEALDLDVARPPPLPFRRVGGATDPVRPPRHEVPGGGVVVGPVGPGPRRVDPALLPGVLPRVGARLPAVPTPPAVEPVASAPAGPADADGGDPIAPIKETLFPGWDEIPPPDDDFHAGLASAYTPKLPRRG